MAIETNMAIANIAENKKNGELISTFGMSLVLFSLTRKNINAPSEKGNEPAGIEK